jgi:lipoprotein-releasing system permease protein
VVLKVGEPFKDYDAIAKRIEGVPGVQHALPLIEGQVMVSSRVQATGGLVRGMSEDGLKSLKLISGNIQFGTLDGFDDSRGIAIGTRLATALGVTHNDSITLVSPRGATTPFGTAPRTKTYKIVALFEMGMSEYDRSVIFMPLNEAQRYFSKRDAVDVLEVLVDDPEAVGNYQSDIRTVIGNTYQTTDWRQRNATFFNVLEVERNVMFIILSLIILVAALNIISGMMMLVKDKGRDIAILRTMGASRGAVMRVFLITGAAIGVVGTLAGFVLGVVFCWNIDAIKNGVAWLTNTQLFDPSIYYLTKLPADIDPWETAYIVAMASAAHLTLDTHLRLGSRSSDRCISCTRIIELLVFLMSPTLGRSGAAMGTKCRRRNTRFTLLTYAFILTVIGTIMVVEGSFAWRRSARPYVAVVKQQRRRRGLNQRLPFRARFNRSKMFISVIPPLFIGSFVGFLTAVMGAGGGFILIPLLVYGLGLNTRIAVGTSAFQVLFVASFTTVIQATVNHNVDLMLGFPLMVGSVIAAQLGVRFGGNLKPEHLRILLGVLVLMVGVRMVVSLVIVPSDLYSLTGVPRG